MNRILKRALFLGLSSVLVVQAGLQAQDVELLGKHHGTKPPQGYYDRMAQDPGAFQFQRALFRRGLKLKELPPVQARGRSLSSVLTPDFVGALAGGAQRAAVTGSFKFPLILGLFSDSPTPLSTYSQGNVQKEFFDGPQAHVNAMGTIPDFYAEISGGNVALSGMTLDWERTNLTQAAVTAGESGLGGDSKVGEFISKILDAVDDGSVDWGQFDNDGPDGVPNSGDDDGYVDVLAIMHPTPGGECSSSEQDDRIWSHRWNLYAAAWFESGASWASPVLLDEGYATTTPATPSPENTFATIRILDYTIQPVTNCGGSSVNTIGVFAHELGHGFGLPDLYGVSSDQNGIGNWGLMGTGSWGCNGTSSELPCHMTAWSKAFLGWVTVQTLAPDTDLGTLTLPPVESSGTIFRMDAGDGSGEYFLLENRQRIGFDQNLYSPGLLIWHIDPEQINRYWSSNRINSDGDHLGVWLRGADGRDDLARDNGGRGDASDPFPGSLLRTEMHAATYPASWSHDGGAMGITLLEIQEASQIVTFRALTGYQPLSLETVGSPSGNGLISVDDVTSENAIWIFNSAPFQKHTITAASGEETGTGYRVGFEGWADGSPRVREYQTGLAGESFTATYGGTEVRVRVAITSPVEGISPGSIDFTPGDEEGWVPEGATVVVMAQPRTGFGFREWAGALSGHPNPTTVTVDAPMEAGALFDLTFSTASNPPSIQLEAATTYFLALEIENANSPVTWTLTSGDMPEGMHLDPIGRITGAAQERGNFPVTFHVRDAIGLEGNLSLDLVVVDPVISIERLASPFLLSGVGMDFNQKAYLDREGNANGVYDLGDFRAFYLRNPNLPRTGDMQGLIELLVPMGALNGQGSGKEVVR